MLKERQQYQHLAAGGWALYGHDPSDYSRKILLCAKPNQPRTDRHGKTIKYETPPGINDRVMLMSVPTDIAATIAAAADLDLPPEVMADKDGSQGSFWAWAAQEPRLGRYLTEGGKKAATGLSHGRLTIGSNGCWNFAPKDGEKYVDPVTSNKVRTGKAQLHPDLQGWIWEGCPTVVVFDRPKKKRDWKAPERMAARRTGWLLRKAGAQVRIGVVPGPEKGIDDWFVAGKTWDALEEHLQEPGSGAVLPRRPAAHVTAPADQFLSEAITLPSPEQAKLVCLQAPMGTGKSVLISQVVTEAMRDGIPVISITHRVNLGAATCAEWGLPWADEAHPGQPLRHLGFGCCIDSLCPESGLRVNPDDWKGAIVILDEAAQVLQALLMGIGTTVAQRRVAVLTTFVKLLANAQQIIASDAQLPLFAVNALEAMTGDRAYVIASERQPFADVPCFVYEDRKAAQARLVTALSHLKTRLWVSTTAAKAGEKNSTVTLEQLVKQYRPDLKVLRVDSDTMADPNHDAARLAENPALIALLYPVIITSPAVAAGLSIPATVPFDAVFGFNGGVTPVADAVQALARVRYSCPRYVYAPDRAPGDNLRVGSGDSQREQVLRHCSDAAAHIIQKLAEGGMKLDAPARCILSADHVIRQITIAGVDLDSPADRAMLDLWADYAATQNGQRLAYRETLTAFLELEGMEVRAMTEDDPVDLVLAEQVNCDMKAISSRDKEAFNQAVIDTPLPGWEEAKKLAEKQRLSGADAVIARRLELAARWGEDAEPNPELLEADSKGLSHKLMLGWLLTTPSARQKVIQGDKAIAQQQSRNCQVWAPDLCRETLGHRLEAAEALGLTRWISRTDSFTADDPQLVELQANATAAASSITQYLGVRPGKDGVKTLRILLKAIGYQLDTVRVRVGVNADGGDNRQRVYRVVAIPLPAGVTQAGIERAWDTWLDSRIKAGTGLLSQKFPYIDLYREKTGTEESGQDSSPPPAATVPPPAPPTELDVLTELLREAFDQELSALAQAALADARWTTPAEQATFIAQLPPGLRRWVEQALPPSRSIPQPHGLEEVP